MNAKPIPPKEMVLIALMFPILGILFGGIYSYPAGRLTKERDPWFTLLLAAGLAFTIFAVGYAVHASSAHLGMVWLASIVLLLLVRAAFGLVGNLEHSGMVHMATLFILVLVLFFTRHPRQASSASDLGKLVFDESVGRIIWRVWPKKAGSNMKEAFYHVMSRGEAFDALAVLGGEGKSS